MSNNIVNCLVLKEYIIIASRVLKTRDSIETRAFKTRFTRFASADVENVCLVEISNSTTHTVSLSLSNTLSVSQALSISEALSLSLSNTLKAQTPKSLKRLPSNVHRPRRQMLKPHSDDPLTHIPTIPSPIP